MLTNILFSILTNDYKQKRERKRLWNQSKYLRSGVKKRPSYANHVACVTDTGKEDLGRVRRSRSLKSSTSKNTVVNIQS